MQNLPEKFNWDTLRSLAFGSISGTYAAVGTVTTKVAVAIRVLNLTDKTVIFSDDGTNDKEAIGTLQSFQYAIPNILIPAGKTFYIKDNGSATGSGAVYISIIYAT